MSNPQPITLTPSRHAAVKARAELAGQSVSAWIRQVLETRTHPGLKPLEGHTRRISVRLPEDLLERCLAAAERAGMPLETWLRAAVEVELDARAFGAMLGMSTEPG